MSESSEQRSWAEASERWIAHADDTAAMTAPASEALIDRLELEPGLAVLDVASGAGDPALRIAELVGASGRVTATDGSRAMLDALARRARERGLANVETIADPVERLDLAPASFDRACCRFGAMFFDDARAGLHRLGRAVVEGGHLVLVVWGARDANPYFVAAPAALDEIGIPAAVERADGHTVFEWSTPGALATLARDAGWRDVREEDVDFRMTLAGVAPEAFLDALCGRSRAVTERLEGVDSSRLGHARRAVADAVARYAADDGLAFPARCLVITARAPA